MNIKHILSIISITTEVGAFSPAPCSSRRVVFKQTTTLRGTVRPDATDAIADALRISQEYGATSKEARIAWDIVEELDSNDSSPAYGIDERDASSDYYDHIRSLSYLLKDTSSKMAQMKTLIGQIKELELEDPTLARIPDESAALKSALADAKAAVEVHGSASPEAKKAWDKLDLCFGENSDGVLEFTEECNIDANGSTYRYSAAALKAHHLYDAAIDSSLLEESTDALGMIEGLAKFVDVEKRRLDGGLGPVSI